MSYYLKKCPKCGKYSDISVEKCQCGENLIRVMAKKVEESLQEDQINEIDDTVPVFEQRCPSCKKVFYIFDKEMRYKKCPNCRKAAIANQEPVAVFPEQKKIIENETSEDASETEENIGSEEIREENEEQIHRSANMQKNLYVLDSWDSVRENLSKYEPENRNTAIGLKATGSRTEIIFQAEEAPILLGRYVLDSIDEGDKKEKRYQQIEELMAADRRVSGYHCHLLYKNGDWYIKDGSWAIPAKGIPEKRSTNSTKVNEKNVEGEVVLHNNDIIKLGNQRDSLILVVSFK